MARARSALVGLAAGVMLAQGVAAQLPASDTARRPRVDLAAIRGGQFVYQMTLERDAGTTIVGTRTVSVSLGSFGGAASWLMLETRAMDNGGVDADSVFADIVGLRPLHWGSNRGSARISADFHGDTAVGSVGGPPGRRSLVAPLPPGTLINSAMLETVLRMLPLNSSWEDSASTLTASLGGVSTLPTRLSVIGEDRVRLPAGTFDCWVVAIHAGDTARGLYWVTKRDPIVVRSALDLPAMGGAQLVTALTRIGR